MKARLLLAFVFVCSQALVWTGGVAAQGSQPPGGQPTQHAPTSSQTKQPALASTVPLGQPGTSFRYVQQFGVTDQAYPGDAQHINRPHGLAIDGSDNLYVVEDRGSRLLKYNSSGANQLVLGTAGLAYSDNYVFQSPQSPGIDAGGNIWVADRNRVAEYTSGGTFVQQFPPNNPWETGSDNAHFNSPEGIAFDSAGRMYVSDRNNDRVQVFQFISGTVTYSNTIGVTGVTGSDSGHFDHPFSVRTDSSDRLYIVDTNNYRVQRCVFSSSWTCNTFYGGNGAGTNLNQMDFSTGLAVDSAHSQVYIADGNNYRVLKCALTFPANCLTSTLFAGLTAAFGSDNTHLQFAADVAVDSAGNVFVADVDNYRVQKFNSAGTYLSTLGVTGVPYVADSARLNTPSGIAVAADGSLYVTEQSGNRALKLNAAGVHQWAAGVAGVYLNHGADNAHLGAWYGGLDGNPAVTASQVYVPDSGNNRIQIYSLGGVYASTFGSYGTSGNDHFNYPTGMAIDPTNGDIYVTDTNNQRVQVYNSAWVYKATLGTTAVSGVDGTHFNYPYGVAVDGSGHIYVADTPNQRIQKCTLSGSSGTCSTFAGETLVSGSDFGHLSNPRSVAVDNSGRVYVADPNNNRVEVFDSSGAYLTTISGSWGPDTSQFRGDVAVAVDAKGTVYVADTTNGRIEEFAPGVPGWRQDNINGFGDAEDGSLWTLQTFKGMLYAGGHSNAGGARLWRSSDGLAWTPATPPNLVPQNSIFVDLAEFHNQLYGASAFVGPGQLWRSPNGTSWTSVITDGVDNNNTNYQGITRLAVFSDTLYAGTYNFGSTGVQIWRSGTGDSLSWTNVVTNGFDGDTHNFYVTNLAVFGNFLYATSSNNADGAEVWRTADGTVWHQVNTDGFGSTDNKEPGGLAQLGGFIYISTRNATTGSQIWRSPNGTSWSPVMTNGFGNPNNQKVQSLLTLDGFLYADSDNQVTGVEIWRSADGVTWTKINPDGWGDRNTTGAVAGSLFAFNNRLLVGAGNGASASKLWEMLNTIDLPLALR